MPTSKQRSKSILYGATHKPKTRYRMRTPTAGKALCSRHYKELKNKSLKSVIEVTIDSILNRPKSGIYIRIKERPYHRLNNLKENYIEQINHIERKILSFIHNLLPRKFQIDFHTNIDLSINNRNPEYEHTFSMKMSSDELSNIAKGAVSSTNNDICFQRIDTKLSNNVRSEVDENGEISEPELARYLFMSFVVNYECVRMPDIADIVKAQRSLNKGLQNFKERMWNPTRESSLLKRLNKKNSKYFKKPPSRYENHLEKIQKEAKARIDRETLQQHFPIM